MFSRRERNKLANGAEERSKGKTFVKKEEMGRFFRDTGALEKNHTVRDQASDFTGMCDLLEGFRAEAHHHHRRAGEAVQW